MRKADKVVVTARVRVRKGNLKTNPSRSDHSFSRKLVTVPFASFVQKCRVVLSTLSNISLCLGYTLATCPLGSVYKGGLQ